MCNIDVIFCNCGACMALRKAGLEIKQREHVEGEASE